jgi:c-di-GMP-binding flagellar brake protein YcgR
MTDEPQRRESDRKQLRGTGRFFLTPSAVIEVRTLDVSTRGAAIVSAANLPIGSTGTLHLGVPDHNGMREQFQVHATVIAAVLSADVDGFRLSLRFDGISESLRAAVERYMAS